MANNETAQVH